MSKTVRIRKFEGFGIEAEYMMVNPQSLEICPISDQVLAKLAGHLTQEWEQELYAWSNELVLHVIELKTNGPTADLIGLEGIFQKAVEHMNALLKVFDCCLMPTAMHPLWRPLTDIKLWPHGDSTIYDTYHRIFHCHGHGWSNLQSIHINFPFLNDQEFAHVHTAIRLVLPLIAPLAASSPLCEGQTSGSLDQRLEFYRLNQKKIPAICGHVVPEMVLSRKEYNSQILEPMYAQIAPYDPQAVLQHEWLNSRGAIARFDRNAIEIRLVDIQECVKADLTVIAAIISTVMSLEKEAWSSFQQQKNFKEQDLESLFFNGLAHGMQGLINQSDYLSVFGFPDRKASFQELWQHIGTQISKDTSLPLNSFKTEFNLLMREGSLALRILNALNNDFREESIKSLYRHLCLGLQENRMFIP